MRIILSLVGAALVLGQANPVHDAQPEGFPSFEKHTIDADFANGYQVSVADIDSDRRPDIIALSTDPPKLVWYRNPAWDRFPITSQGKAYIDAAPYDINGDGRPDLALASDFSLQDSTHGGALHWVECPPDPARQHEWQMRPIAAIPTSHRVRWADLGQNARKVLLDLPIVGIGAHPPDYAAGVQFTAYTIPDEPQAGAWKSFVLDNTLNMAHGLLLIRWNDDPHDAVLTASFDGVHLFQKSPANQGFALAERDVPPGAQTFVKRQLGVGHQGPRPNQGSSEVGYGKLDATHERFVAAIEPWHGTEVVVYSSDKPEQMPWPRTVLDASFNNGHGLVCADLDRDGNDEIIAGYRGAGCSLYIYRYAAAQREWRRIPLDVGAIAVAGLAIADINQDGSPDIIATGTSTNNVVWYENHAKVTSAQSIDPSYALGLPTQK